MARDPVALVRAFNAGREPERLALKYRAMANDPFAFLRGSCALFYRDYAQAGVSIDSPAAWISGDLHLENFGSYLDDERLAHFDLNDFGEALLAPVDWELARFLTSVLVAGESLKLKPDEALDLCNIFLAAYADTLLAGKVCKIDEDSAKGMVRDLLDDVRERSNDAYLEERTQISHGKRQLRVDGEKALPICAADREKVAMLIDAHAQTQPDPKFFKLLDVARRIAGTGSLGIERYVLLVHGPGGNDLPALLDLRHEPGSALAQLCPLTQPYWPSEAERVVSIQRRMQAAAPAFLTALRSGERSYVLRELLPNQDRLKLEKWNGKFGRLENVMRSMGRALAWAQLRAADWRGSVGTAELQTFGARLPALSARLLEHSRRSAQQVIADWRVFREAQQLKN
jgi:uncharacterized protein (DUF2252 family)